MMNIQSNSLRGEFMHEIVDRTVKEIQEDIVPMLGPGATDAFIIKDGAPYYTRDGKEVLESLRFDNELAMYVHHILYQAVYNQGHNVGDGSTTLGVFYTHLYQLIRKELNFDGWAINTIRKIWNQVVDDIISKLTERAKHLDDDLLLSMLYTCTQDSELAGKIYTTLKDAIMAGAYIVPRKSNIATDFNVTVYNRPTFKVTRQFSLKPIENGEVKDAVVLYCNGMLDISHIEVLSGIINTKLTNNPEDPYVSRPLNFMILCHGLTETTRRVLRKLSAFMKDNNVDVSQESNLAIYTLDDYRAFDTSELEAISTLIIDEPGLGGAVNAITYEHLLYAAFNVAGQIEHEIEELEQFDLDPHCVDCIKSCIMQPTMVIIDAVEGLSICKELGPHAQEQYNSLRKEISEEKSPIRKHELTRKMRRIYGMFIDIEVGSVLLKDSQRKFELILDAIISSSEAAKDGVLIGNSMLHVIDICDSCMREYITKTPKTPLISMIYVCYHYIRYAMSGTFMALYKNCYPMETQVLVDGLHEEERDPETFGYNKDEEISFTNPDGNKHQIQNQIVEPLGVMKAILENCILPVELAMTNVFHISGTNWSIGNYIQ